MKVNLPGLPIVMEPKTTGMAVLGEPIFANVLLRFDRIRVREILACESGSRRTHKYTNAYPAFGVSCNSKRHVRSLNPAAAEVLPAADESPSSYDWPPVELDGMQRRVV
jgi:hypothetical protein